jgi:5-methylcytosine-specific restriction endonuclease McrA
VDDTAMATFTKVCFYCKWEFEATHSLANICSPECQERARSSPARQAQPGTVSGTRPAKSPPEPADVRPETCGIDVECRRCGKVLRDATGTRRYCSSTCRKAEQRGRRREVLRRAHVEDVTMAELRRRDEDRCRICGEPVDFTKRPPDPSAATIDHVIALSRGGEHSYGNTQLAHLRCNTAKGAG